MLFIFVDTYDSPIQQNYTPRSSLILLGQRKMSALEIASF